MPRLHFVVLSLVLSVGCKRSENPAVTTRDALANSSTLVDIRIDRGRFAAAFDHDVIPSAILVGDVATTAPPVRVKSGHPRPRRPLVSPDGQWLAFTHGEPADGGVTVLDLATRSVLFSVDGTRLCCRGEAWSADGRSFLFRRSEGGVTQIRRFDIGARQDVALTGTFTNPSGFAFSPVGKRLAFLDQAKLFIADSEGNDRRQVSTEADQNPRAAAWSPDGRRIAYIVDAPGGCSRVVIAATDASSIERLLPEQCATQTTWLSADRLAVVTPDVGIVSLSIPSLEAKPIIADPKTEFRAIGAVDARSIIVATRSETQPFVGLTVRSLEPSQITRELVPSPSIPRTHISTATELRSVRGERMTPHVFRFPRTCGEPDKPGLAVVWLPCSDGAEYTPWYQQEIQYLTLLGAAVYVLDAPYYRPSTPNATTQLARASEAVDAIARQPDVAPDSMVVFGCCGSSPLAYALAGAGRFWGLIDLAGEIPLKTQELLLPEVRDVRVLFQDLTKTRRELPMKQRAILQQLGPNKILKSYPTDHYYRNVKIRSGLLHDWTDFVAPRMVSACKDS